MASQTAVFFPAQASRARSSAWVRGPVWDGVWMLNALWLAPIAMWLSRGYSDPESGPLNVLYFGLTALFWIGHRLGSTWLAYCTEAYRPLLRAEPVRFIAIPLLVTGACFAVFLPSDSAFPWTREERFAGMAILDYAFVTFHFAAQHFGALSLYRARAERGGCLRTRRLDRVFALGAGGALIFVADFLAGTAAYQGSWTGGELLSEELASLIRQAALVALAGTTAVMLISEARAARPSLPRTLYIVGLSAMVAIALHPRSVFLFLVIWTSQHWILATGLASQTASGEAAPESGNLRRVMHVLNARPWASVLVLTGVSVILLPFFEVEAVGQEGAYYGDWIFGKFAEGLRSSSWVPAFIAIGFATGFVHYLLDRNVYRMSDPRVRAAASGIVRQ